MLGALLGRLARVFRRYLYWYHFERKDLYVSEEWIERRFGQDL